ncbi:MAG: MarR family winged helix-turn-helix transcriptional regulator [Alphaproteobacteria bacterium]
MDAEQNSTDDKHVTNPISIDDSPFFQFMRLVNLTAKPFNLRFSKQYSLTLNEWRVMMALASYPGLAAHELAQLIGIDKMSISRAVRRMTSMGRISRDPDPGDRRRTLLRLTPDGREVFLAIAPAAKTRERTLFSALSDTEERQLRRLLRKLEDTVRGWETEDDDGN